MRGQLAKLDKAVELIESARKAGGRVLSHCWHGRNRRWVWRRIYSLYFSAVYFCQVLEMCAKHLLVKSILLV